MFELENMLRNYDVVKLVHVLQLHWKFLLQLLMLLINSTNSVDLIVPIPLFYCHISCFIFFLRVQSSKTQFLICPLIILRAEHTLGSDWNSLIRNLYTSCIEKDVAELVVKGQKYNFFISNRRFCFLSIWSFCSDWVHIW